MGMKQSMKYPRLGGGDGVYHPLIGPAHAPQKPLIILNRGVNAKSPSLPGALAQIALLPLLAAHLLLFPFPSLARAGLLETACVFGSAPQSNHLTDTQEPRNRFKKEGLMGSNRWHGHAHNRIITLYLWDIKRSYWKYL